MTSTGICPSPDRCGVMQSGAPMPFADTAFPPPDAFTNSAGIVDGPGGTMTTTLTGTYVRIVDACGPLSESTAASLLDLGGVNGQHDCVSGSASPGNTPAARTSFYEINKLVEAARGWLPSNLWLQAQLLVNVNINGPAARPTARRSAPSASIAREAAAELRRSPASSPTSGGTA